MIHRLQRFSTLSALIALGVVVPSLVVAAVPAEAARKTTKKPTVKSGPAVPTSKPTSTDPKGPKVPPTTLATTAAGPSIPGAGPVTPIDVTTTSSTPRTEPTKPSEPPRSEPPRSEPPRTEPTKPSEPPRTEPTKPSEPPRSEPPRTEPTKPSEPPRTEPPKPSEQPRSTEAPTTAPVRTGELQTPATLSLSCSTVERFVRCTWSGDAAGATEFLLLRSGGDRGRVVGSYALGTATADDRTVTHPSNPGYVVIARDASGKTIAHSNRVDLTIPA